MKSLELFVGTGGLALGVSNAGFEHEAVIEWNANACHNIRRNQNIADSVVANWPLHEGDVRGFDFSPYSGKIDLLAGGPPCQPFSIGGNHRGQDDDRNMFPQMIRAVRELRPKVIFIENVKGLLRSAFREYFEYVLLQITYPELEQRADEDWVNHLARLERYHTRGIHDGLSYRVTFRLFNAADYGVPQKRERVFIVAIRNDLDVDWSFPDPTHSSDALLFDKWVTGHYWERHRVADKFRPVPPARSKSKIERLRKGLIVPDGSPWRTVRDAICDLPDPITDGNEAWNHVFHPGARVYPGHTGSQLDEPSKTLKAGDHGVPGGENMLVNIDGSVRYFTVRESARLQTFPDNFIFHGPWSESMRQLGNAVPVKLAEIVARTIKAKLEVRNVRQKGGRSHVRKSV